MIEQFEVHRIWNKATHNAFTDLIRFHGRWFCAFREASGHRARDGALRIITSADGVTWNSAASIACPAPFQDLRDPQLSITPNNVLMLNAAAFKPVCQSMVWLSQDGYDWGGIIRSAPAVAGYGARYGTKAWPTTLGVASPMTTFSSCTQVPMASTSKPTANHSLTKRMRMNLIFYF